jgi:hypothetical protein
MWRNTMSDVSTRTSSALRNGRVIVSLTAGLCLILLTVVLKNVLLVPAAQLSSDYIGLVSTFPLMVILYIIISESEPREPVSPSRTTLWVFVFVMITLAIIGIYAI